MSIATQYLTYCALNLVSVWSRAKSPGGGGAVSTKEGVATENASQLTQITRLERCCIFYSVLTILQAIVAKQTLDAFQIQMLPHKANPKTTRFIPSPSHFRLRVQPSPHFAAMPPVSSAFILSLLETILTVFVLDSTTPFFLLD